MTQVKTFYVQPHSSRDTKMILGLNGKDYVLSAEDAMVVGRLLKDIGKERLEDWFNAKKSST